MKNIRLIPSYYIIHICPDSEFGVSVTIIDDFRRKYITCFSSSSYDMDSLFEYIIIVLNQYERSIKK